MKARRKELGYSADYVADKLKVSRSTIFRYEGGEIEKLPIDILEPLSAILHTTPAYLMGWISDPAKSAEPIEQQFVRKFKSLDEKGKHTVMTVLNIEYDRCKRLEPVAAHNDDMSDEQLELMRQDLEDL
jgi:transcriptional regulator with XRE-family HTH domain